MMKLIWFVAPLATILANAKKVCETTAALQIAQPKKDSEISESLVALKATVEEYKEQMVDDGDAEDDGDADEYGGTRKGSKPRKLKKSKSSKKRQRKERQVKQQRKDYKAFRRVCGKKQRTHFTESFMNVCPPAFIQLTPQECFDFAEQCKADSSWKGWKGETERQSQPVGCYMRNSDGKVHFNNHAHGQGSKIFSVICKPQLCATTKVVEGCHARTSALTEEQCRKYGQIAEGRTFEESDRTDDLGQENRPSGCYFGKGDHEGYHKGYHELKRVFFNKNGFKGNAASHEFETVCSACDDDDAYSK